MSVIKVDYGEVGGGGNAPLFEDVKANSVVLNGINTGIKATDAQFVFVTLGTNSYGMYGCCYKVENGTLTTIITQNITASLNASNEIEITSGLTAGAFAPVNVYMFVY